MKRFVIKILIFFAIVSVIDIAIGHVGDYLQFHAKSGDAYVLNNLVLNKKHDVLVMGSSRAHHHYDTPFLSDTLNMDVYNAGYDGNGVVLAYGLLEMILERYNPKLVLYDVEPAFDINIYEPDHNHKRYISNLKPYYRQDGVGIVIKDVSREEWYKVHSGLIRYNSTIIPLLMSYLRPGPIENNKGFEPLEGECNYDSEVNNDETVPIVDSFKLAYMEKMLTLLNENDIPVVVVASPKLDTTSSCQLEPVRDICKSTGTSFLDYYNDVLFMEHKEWFKDRMHLNETGAREFSKVIIKDFQDLISNKN